VNGDRGVGELSTTTQLHVSESDDDHTESAGENARYRVDREVGRAERAQTRAAGFPLAVPEMNVERQMVMWPALTLLGFLVLTGLVIAMGTQSTARYEAEKRAASTPRARTTAAEAARVTATATAVI